MIYATWQLDFQDPMFGTGPESKINSLGITAESSWATLDNPQEMIILGYLSNTIDETDFNDWNLKIISQDEALNFCLGIDSEAYLLEDKFTAPSKII